MTVCVAIKVHDCIVFAADSASSLSGVDDQGNATIYNVWSHGLKVFNLHKGLPLTAMTCGLGHLGPVSISTLAKDLRLNLSREDSPERLNEQRYEVRQVAEKSLDFFRGVYEALEDKPVGGSLEFWVGGYGRPDGSGEIWKIALINGEWHGPLQVAAADTQQIIAWAGQPEAINRLVIGFDMQLYDALRDAGVDENEVGPIIEQLQARTETRLVHAAMPVQDAINLADFLVDITKRYFSFKPGADIVGGDTDIAVVTKHEGFKWIKRKHYYPAALNPVETNHVQ